MLRLEFAAGTAPRAGRKASDWFDDHGRVLARAFSRDDLYWIEWHGVGVFASSIGSYEVRVWPEPDVRHEIIADTFSRMVRPIVLQALGEGQVLHAAAVVGPAGLLAFCGKSGSGKSTLAFAIHQVGYRQFADDTLLLRIEQGRVIGRALPFTPRLRPASRAYFAHLCRPLPSSPEAHPVDSPLSAIFLLQQNPGLANPRLSVVPQRQAFSDLLTLAHCFDTEDLTHVRRLVNDYLDVVARVRTFKLEYRPDFQKLNQLTRSIADVARIERSLVCLAPGVHPSDGRG